jgi:hydroxyacylglutathione hydrolase
MASRRRDVIDIVTIATAALGNRSHVVHDGTSAVVIDPPRDIDRVTDVLDTRGLHVTHVLETHLHNDYVTGGLELARRTGATYALAAGAQVAFDRQPVHDGDELVSGGMRFRAVHTPGHTPEHHSYVLFDGERPLAAFTGGSLLYGAVGRTDLVDDRLTEQLTRAQFRSVRRLTAQLPPDVALYPTHGFGSFCASTPGTDADASTIADEQRGNTALTTDDEDAFVESLIAGFGDYPRYYAHMAPINRAGPPTLDLTPPAPLSPQMLRERLHAGDWVIDVRPRTAFAAAHLTGTVNIELADDLATYVGWMVPWGLPITLVGDTPDQVAEAQRMIARIGIDRPAGQATGGPAAFAAGSDVRGYEVSDFTQLAKALANAGEGRSAVAQRGGGPGSSGGVHVLDVRRDEEWNRGHIPGAQHIHLPDLPARLHEVPDDAPTWVHCRTGYRSSIAASLLDRAGKPVVLVDDDWKAAVKAGISQRS